MASKLFAEIEAMFCEKVCATVEGVFVAVFDWENWPMFAGTGVCVKGAEKLSIDAAVKLAVGFHVNQTSDPTKAFHRSQESKQTIKKPS